MAEEVYSVFTVKSLESQEVNKKSSHEGNFQIKESNNKIN